MVNVEKPAQTVTLWVIFCVENYFSALAAYAFVEKSAELISQLREM